MKKAFPFIPWMQAKFEYSSLFWVRFVTVLILLALCSYLGYFGSTILLQYGLLVILALPIVMIFLRQPVIGLIVTLVSGLTVSYTGPGGVNATIGMVMLCMGLWLFDMVVFQNEIRLIPSRMCVPVYVLAIISLLSFGMGQLSYYAYVSLAPLDAQLGGFFIFFLSFGGFILIANQIKTLQALKWLTWAFLFVGAVFVANAILKATGLLPSSLQGIFKAIFGSAQQGGMFWIWFVAIAFSQALFNRDLHFGWRIFMFGTVFITLYILFVLQFKNKSGWVPVFIVLWVIITLRSWQLGAVLLIAGILGFLTLIPQILETEEYSLSTRLEIIPIYWQILQVNPIFGVGFANYRFITPLFSLRGFYVAFNSHNNYVDIAVQTGLLGLVSYFWFLLEVGFMGLKIRTRKLDGFSQAYINGALGGLVGVIIVGLLGDWVLPFVYNIGLNGFRISLIAWLLLGGVAVLEKIFLLPNSS